MASSWDLDPALADRGAGAIIGAAVGDALGAGYEFSAPPEPHAVEMRIGTLSGDPPGTWTDDTAMTVCVLEAAAAGHRLDEAEGQVEAGRGFLRWYASHPPDVGVQTRAVLRAVEGDGFHDAARAYAAANALSAGNGSLMRTAPVALRHFGDAAALARAAESVSALTHADPLATDACVLWSAAIEQALVHGSLAGPAAGLDLLPADRRGAWGERIAAAERGPASAFRPNGFVVTALQAAWAAAHRAERHDDPFADGVREAIAIGDDTDTVGAIAGALLGALVGASGIPAAWRDAITGWPDGVDANWLAERTRMALIARTGEASGPTAAG